MIKNSRHNKLGIKQTIQIHWMDRVLHFLLAGMSESEIRNDLNVYLATQKQSGGVGKRGDKTYGIAIGILASWFSPSRELNEFRNAALKIAITLPKGMILPLHWSVISATYPFWFNIAWQVGRLLSLQELITQSQVFNRIKEQYGDRESVVRNSRYAVRSFVAWKVLKDTDARGCYKVGKITNIENRELAVLMLESALHATNEGKGTLSSLMNHPAFFPFQMPSLTAEFISHNSDRIEVVRHNIDDTLLVLKVNTERQQTKIKY